MNSLAANATGRRVPAPACASRRAASACSLVEDLNWPAPQPQPAPADRKAPRHPEVWVPGPQGDWDGAAPTLQ